MVSRRTAMVDDYTAKMTELIELMRMIGNDLSLIHI